MPLLNRKYAVNMTSFMTDAYHYLYILSTDTKTWKSEFSFIFVYFVTYYTASECWC